MSLSAGFYYEIGIPVSARVSKALLLKSGQLQPPVPKIGQLDLHHIAHQLIAW
jgi:hypothetical protein